MSITTEIIGSAAWLRIDRPEVLNALNREALCALRDGLQIALDNDQIRAIVLIGEGGRAFSTGGDVKAIAHEAAAGAGDESEMESIRLFDSLRRCSKPTIAAVDGYCMGAGFEVALLCDMILATGQSRFTLPEVRLSLMPDPGLLDLPRIIPPGELKRMLLAGRPMPASRAFELGLVQELFPDRRAMIEGVKAICEDIALGAPLAVEAYKQIANHMKTGSSDGARRLRATWWTRLKRSEDWLEGPRAFAERRAPIWRGR